jgi:3-isopropylmalate dehydrogenase
LSKEAGAIEMALDSVLKQGYRTYDIMAEGMTEVGTKEMGDLICRNLGG